MFSQGFFQTATGQAVAGDIDDIVDTAHDEQVAIVVQIAAIAAAVVTLELAQVAIDQALRVAPEGAQGAGR
jgi:hypothetical protein